MKKAIMVGLMVVTIATSCWLSQHPVIDRLFPPTPTAIHTPIVAQSTVETTAKPTVVPTAAPTATMASTSTPAHNPTPAPTAAPTVVPTAAPTATPEWWEEYRREKASDLYKEVVDYTADGRPFAWGIESAELEKLTQEGGEYIELSQFVEFDEYELPQNSKGVIGIIRNPENPDAPEEARELAAKGVAPKDTVDTHGYVSLWRDGVARDKEVAVKAAEFNQHPLVVVLREDGQYYLVIKEKARVRASSSSSSGGSSGGDDTHGGGDGPSDTSEPNPTPAPTAAPTPVPTAAPADEPAHNPPVVEGDLVSDEEAEEADADQGEFWDDSSSSSEGEVGYDIEDLDQDFDTW